MFSPEAIDIVTKLLIVGVLVFANGFFVAAEFALVKVRATQLELLAKKGSKRAKLASNIVGHLDAYLSACQLGITLASLGLGWAGEKTIGKIVQKVLHGFGMHNEHLIDNLELIIGFSVITFLHIVVGELAPKSLAIQKPTETSLWVSWPFHLFYKISYPFIWVLNTASTRLLSLVGIRPASEHEMAHSAEEFRMLINESQKSRKVSKLGKELVINTLDLNRRVAREVMVPRIQMVYLSTQKTLKENLEIARKTKHTRFPVGNPDLDNVIGIIHLKDVLWLLYEKGENAELKSVVRPVMVIPEFVPLEKLLLQMQAKHSHLAIVADEFGGTVGMVTFENILEEIVGDIQDEFDAERPLWQKTGMNQWVVDGTMALHDFNDVFGLDLKSEDATTIGGYILKQLEQFPRGGERLMIGNHEAQVHQTDGLRVKQILLTKKAVETPATTQAGTAE